jgi:hypothetical protein
MNRIMMLLVTIIVACAFQSSFAMDRTQVPEPLKPWIDWSLHGFETQYEGIEDLPVFSLVDKGNSLNILFSGVAHHIADVSPGI